MKHLTGRIEDEAHAHPRSLQRNKQLHKNTKGN